MRFRRGVIFTNVFEAVRDAVTAREAAERYGIEVNRNGMALCPFHDDKNPSLKLDRRFHCFGCQADGDVINFTADLFDISSKEAAVKLAEDFHLSYDGRPRDSPAAVQEPIKPKLSAELEFRKNESYCYYTLLKYRRLLEQWKEEYAPKTPEEEWHPLFVEALQRKDYVNYLLEDVFLYGTAEDKAQFILEHGKDVIRLERRICELTDGRTGCPAAGDGRDGETPVRTDRIRPEVRPAHRPDDRAL